MNPVYVPPADIEDAWPHVEAWIDSALEYSGNLYAPEHIKAECARNAMQLWMVLDDGAVKAVIVTSIQDYPLQKVANIVICTGKQRDGWQDMVRLLEAWARENGCTRMRPIAREGWYRFLKPLGYRKTHVMLEKDL